jgi:DNA modification methylase
VPKPKTPRPTFLDLCALPSGESLPFQATSHTLAVHTDGFAWLPDGSVDLVLTDPPFNIAQDTNFHTYEKNTINSYRFDADKGWDTYTPESFIELLGAWAKEFARVLRPGGSFAVFCADAYVSHLIDALEAAGLKPRRTLTWRKPNAVPINRKTMMMMSSCEYVVMGVKGSKATFNADLPLAAPAGLAEVEQVVVADKAAAIVEKAVREALAAVTTNGAARSADVATAIEAAVKGAAKEAATRGRAMYVNENGQDFLRACVPNHVSFNSKAGGRLHPTEKPVPLLRYLTALLSNPGDVVLDPFGGSGSTGEAASGLGRCAVVVERESDFFDKLSQRLRSLPAQAVTASGQPSATNLTETSATL